MKTFDVTIIKPSTGERQTVRVSASDEWKARTVAMMSCTIRFQGAVAEYEVKEVTK